MGFDLLPPHLSPSSASLYQQCPRKWKHRYVDRLPDPAGEAALAGTFAHRVLELLLAEPCEDRTIDRARGLAREAWPELEADPEYLALALDEEAARSFRWRGWKAIEGLWTIEDPCSVDVEATERDVEVHVGGVPFRGIIDRVDRHPGGLVVTDYKSGQAPSPRFRDDKLTQVLLYAAALAEITGSRPLRARLLYLGQQIIDVEVTDDNLGAAVDQLGATWQELQDSCRADQFAARTGPLCGWCPFVTHCPEGQAEVKMRYDGGMLRADAPAIPVLIGAA